MFLLNNRFFYFILKKKNHWSSLQYLYFSLTNEHSSIIMKEKWKTRQIPFSQCWTNAGKQPYTLTTYTHTHIYQAMFLKEKKRTVGYSLWSPITLNSLNQLKEEPLFFFSHLKKTVSGFPQETKASLGAPPIQTFLSVSLQSPFLKDPWETGTHPIKTPPLLALSGATL